ncbi:MAG: hypothetical protein FWC64_00255 [Treponema sp.]|nr:hypothetical protein [Treponema sp.]
MKRMELIANRSVESEILDALEETIEDFYYILLPQVHGKGKTKYRLGTSVWPEMNFLLISYLDDPSAAKAQEAIREVKARFPKEGIKVFVMDVTV